MPHRSIWRTTAMSDLAPAPLSSTRPVYAFDLPHHIPFFAIGMLIRKFKQIGIWDRMPQPIKQKTKAAKSSWSGVTITKKDVDSLPDDVWLKMAREFRLEWRQVEVAPEAQV